MRVGDLEKTARLMSQVILLTSGLMILICLAVLALVWDLEKSLLIGSALAALSALLLPGFLEERYDVFQPLSFAIASVLIGVTGRTLYVILSSSSRATEFLLRGEEPEFLLPAGLITAVGLAFFAFGYVQRFPRLTIRRPKIARCDTWNKRRLFMVVTVLALVSLIATGAFLKEAGFSLGAFSDLSSKRLVGLEDSELGYTALGYLRWGASLSQVAFLLVLTWFADSRKKWRSIAGFGVVLMFAVAALFPILASKRGVLLWLVLSGVIVWHYVRNRLSLRSVVAFALVALVTLSVMLSFRSGSAKLWEALTPRAVCERVVGSRDFLDITATAFIIEAVHNGTLEVAYGATYLTWLYAPIPRTLWKGKPVISVGVTLNRAVFGATTNQSGTPPGIIGEAYWNFGPGGVVVVMWLAGAIVGALYRAFRLRVSRSKNMALIYAAVIAPWSLGLLGGSWSVALISALQTLLPLLVLLHFVTKPSSQSVAQALDDGVVVG